jgi:mannose-6-phosphate isomerase-like protein (cupin superfamily)
MDHMHGVNQARFRPQAETESFSTHIDPQPDAVSLNPMEIIELDKQVAFEAPDLAVVREWISPRNSRAERISMAEITIPAGVRIHSHYHKVTEEHYFITKGTGRMELAGAFQEVNPGAAIVILPGEVHSIENTGSEPLEMLVTCVPHWEADDQVFV